MFNVGSVGIDAIRMTDPMSRAELEASLDFPLEGKVILGTFHPVTLDGLDAGLEQLDQVLAAFGQMETDCTLVITGANADTGGPVFNQRIEAFCRKAPHAHFRASLGSRRYLSLMRLADLVVGNSSSGLAETPALGIPVVNIGDRQRGRMRSGCVIDVEPQQEAIFKAMVCALTPEFKVFARECPNPYGDGHAAERILKIMAGHRGQITLKKVFHDLPEQE